MDVLQQVGAPKGTGMQARAGQEDCHTQGHPHLTGHARVHTHVHTHPAAHKGTHTYACGHTQGTHVCTGAHKGTHMHAHAHTHTHAALTHCAVLIGSLVTLADGNSREAHSVGGTQDTGRRFGNLWLLCRVRGTW